MIIGGVTKVDQAILECRRYIGLGAAGAAIGLIAGIVARPTFMGIKIPLSVITSKYPGDAPFKSELLTHLGLYLAAGAGIGLVAAFALISMSRGTTAAPARAQAFDSRKWQTLVEIDPEIAAQVKRIAPFGQVYVDELAEKYLSIGDKAYLGQIADAVAGRAEAALAEQKAVEASPVKDHMGYRYHYDADNRFWGEIKAGSSDFRAFMTEGMFRTAVTNYLTRGAPPIEASALAQAEPAAPAA